MEGKISLRRLERLEKKLKKNLKKIKKLKKIEKYEKIQIIQEFKKTQKNMKKFEKFWKNGKSMKLGKMKSLGKKTILLRLHLKHVKTCIESTGFFFCTKTNFSYKMEVSWQNGSLLYKMEFSCT